MILLSHTPPDALLPFIDSIIYFKGYTPEHSIERVVPDGHTYLIFELDNMPRHTFDNDTLEPNKEFTKAWVSGMQSSYISISAMPDSEMYVFRFKPGGIYPFIQKDLDSISDSVIPAESFFGEAIFEFREQLLGADSPEEKFSLGEEWAQTKLEQGVRIDDSIHAAVSKIMSDPQFWEISLKDIIDESGYSQKHFISLFKKYVGLSPKYFQRILRFQEIMMKTQNKEQISWPSISSDCGFYDQAHFIREFKKFSGYNPGEFIVEQEDHDAPNFFPLD